MLLRSPNTPIRNTEGAVFYSSHDLEIWSNDPRHDLNDDSTQGVAGSYKPASVDVRLQTTDLVVYLFQDTALSSTPFQLIGELNGRLVANGY